MNEDKKVHRHIFQFDPKNFGGEAVSLETIYFDNGDGEIYINQELKLQSYCNHASIHLHGTAIVPEDLRRLANELDEARIKARASVKAERELNGNVASPN